MLEKKNTFYDFIAVANHLVTSDVTRPETLVAKGGSAGGLLMGAVANMAPGLFAGILAQVPYYFTSAVALGAPLRPVAFTVPTGNFGDIFAGYAAKAMGLPVAGSMITSPVSGLTSTS